MRPPISWGVIMVSFDSSMVDVILSYMAVIWAWPPTIFIVGFIIAMFMFESVGSAIIRLARGVFGGFVGGVSYEAYDGGYRLSAVGRGGRGRYLDSGASESSSSGSSSDISTSEVSNG